MKRLLKLLRAAIPQKLPITTEGLEKFAGDILALGGWPVNDSNLHAVAQMILHLEMGTTRKSQLYFYNTLRRSVTNEVAYGLMQELKQRKQAQQEKASDEQAKEASSQVEPKIS